MPNSLRDLISRFQSKIKEFRIRVREFLRDFDLLRLGKITQSQFRSGLSIAKLPLSEAEFKLLCEEYRFEDGIDWRKFCDHVEQVFQVKGLETSDPSQPIDSLDLNYRYGRKDNSFG